MKKINKLVVTSLLFIIIGMGLLITGFLLGGRVYGFSLNQDGFHVNAPALNETSEITYIEEAIALETFDSIDADTEFLKIDVSSEDSYGISYKVNSQSRFSYEITDGVLKIEEQYKNTNNAVNFQWFSFGSTDSTSMEEQYLEIYVPKNADLKTISIKNSFSDVSLSELNAKEVSIQSDFSDIAIHDLNVAILTAKTESGDLEIENTTGDTLSIDTSFGDTELSQLHFKETSELTSASGDFTIDDSYFHFWNVTADFGDVEGNSISCDTASLDLESSNCDLNDFTVNSMDAESSFGDITLRLAAPADSYGYELRTEFGSIDLEGYDTQEDSLIISNDSDNRLTIDCESGDIKISGS